MSRNKYPVDPDRLGGGSLVEKTAAWSTQSEYDERAAERAGLRDLDSQVEALPGMTRQQRDLNRAGPRATSQDVPDERMRRKLPEAGQIREPLSSRQRKARSAAKQQAQDLMPRTQKVAIQDLVQDRTKWTQLNDRLSEAAGDVDNLDENHRAAIQRTDRAIQSFERSNDRGHVVYTNVKLPPGVNSGNIGAFLSGRFSEGDFVEFDRYTAGTHCLHELDAGTTKPHRTAVFEIQTRRGAYLGRSDSLDDTRHLLPRSMRFRIAGIHSAVYQRPDGITGERRIIQLIDTEEEA